MTSKEGKIEVQGGMVVFCFCRHSLFSPLPLFQSKQAHQTAASTSARRGEIEGGEGGDRQTELLPSDVSDGPIWFRSVLQSIISTVCSSSECPSQLDVMTKTLWVRVDKFPWVCAVQVYLALQPQIISIFPSLSNNGDKWSVAVIQSIRCLPDHTLDKVGFTAAQSWTSFLCCCCCNSIK